MHTFDWLKNEHLPNLLLDLDALDNNCSEIAKKANGKKIRVATKSIRSVKVLERILSSDPIYQGVMCFTADEAIFLAEKGFKDILIGYPSWDEYSLAQISKLSDDLKVITVMVDCLQHVEFLAQIAVKTSGTFNLCIDVDMSSSFAGFHFGVRRSPLKTADEVLKVVERINQYGNLKFKGMMGYEAQIAGVGDDAPSKYIKNKLVSIMKQKSISEVENRRTTIISALKKHGFPPELVNGGGTGSITTTVIENEITEVTVGSGFYAPLLFDYYRDMQYEPALFFALPIVRKPGNHIYTCLGGGYVASGAVDKDKLPMPIFPKGAKLLPMEGAGEVQTPIYYDLDELKIGDAIIFRAAKAGEVCERFTDILCYTENQIVDCYKTYRGDGVCFL